MTSLKFALIALVAFSAVQCHGANVPEPEPRDLDAFLAVQNAIKIVKNVINAVEKGIEESRPSIDILVQQLTPELGKAVRKVLDVALNVVRKERQRIEFMIKEVEDLMEAIKKVKGCTDPVKKDLEKALEKLENGALEAVRATLKNNAEDIDDTRKGFYKLLNEFRNMVDGEIKGVIGCLKPGHPNAKKCIEDEGQKVKMFVVKFAGKLLMFVDEVSETLSAVLEDLVPRIPPLTGAFKKDMEPVMKSISDCIAKMK